MRRLNNFINGEWVESKLEKFLDVENPGTGEIISRVPQGCKDDLDLAAAKAAEAFVEWKDFPAEKRIQYLFKMKIILEKNADEIASICTKESGKTFAESKGEMRTNRCTPLSPASRPKAYSPVMVNVADLMPASSPSW